MTQYSFRDLTGAFVHPDTGSFIIAGPELGIGQLTITMNTDRTVHDISADGNVMVSYVAGDNGQIVIEMQQTCALNTFLIGWFDTVKTAADSGFVGNWAAATISLRCLIDGATHIITGVSPLKVPDKVYQSQGQRISWTLMAANVVTM